MAYLPSTGTQPRTVTVDLKRLNGPVTARWFNPTNGTYIAIADSTFTNSFTCEFTTPGNNGTGTSDWVLVLDTGSPQVSRNEPNVGPAPFKPNYDESKVPVYQLPDPLLLSSGQLVTRPRRHRHGAAHSQAA